jgi:hypothetical protein
VVVLTASPCPYCFQRVELFVDPDTEGSYVEDCEICCRPWQITVARDGDRLDAVEAQGAVSREGSRGLVAT